MERTKWNILQNEEYVTNILELAGLGVFLADIEGNCLYVNQEWQNISGQTREESLGMGWQRLILEEDISMVYSILQTVINDYSQVVTFEYRIRHAEKGIVFIKANMRMQKLDSAYYFLGCVQDITNLRMAEKQLQSNNVSLISDGKNKDRMIRALAHDLRNPIEGINTLTKMMLDDAGHNEETKEMLELIHHSSTYSAEMIHSLVAATLPDYGETVKRKKVDLRRLLTQSVHLQQLKANKKKQTIILKTTAPVFADVDPEQISRVFDNLISNAIKFSFPDTQITVFLADLDNKITISVHDQGIGIPPELRPKIFDMFTASKRSGTKNEPSFGLGLSICKQIIEAHGGSIWFTSSPTTGTSFYIELISARAITKTA